MTDLLKGKTAIVTGSARGLGLAIAEAFVAEGLSSLSQTSISKPPSQQRRQGVGKVLRRDAGPLRLEAKYRGELPEGSLPGLRRAVSPRSWPGGGTFPNSCGPARVRFVQSRCRWHLAWWPHGFGIRAYQRAD